MEIKSEELNQEEKSDNFKSEKDTKTKSLGKVDEEIQEWKPIDTEETQFEEIIEEKPENEKELQGWEPIVSEKNKKEGLEKRRYFWSYAESIKCYIESEVRVVDFIRSNSGDLPPYLRENLKR